MSKLFWIQNCVFTALEDTLYSSSLNPHFLKAMKFKVAFLLLIWYYKFVRPFEVRHSRFTSLMRSRRLSNRELNTLRRQSTLGIRRTEKTLLHSAQSSTGIKTLDWSFADGLYLITTNAGGDRLKRTMQELEKVGIAGSNLNVRVFKADDEDRIRGCYTSHIAVMEEIEKLFANKKNYNVIILEDNLEVTKRFQTDSSVIDKVGQFVKTNKAADYDVFHLGYMMYVPGLQTIKMDEQGIVKLLSGPQTSIGTSAYCISRKGLNAILSFHRKHGYQNDAIPNLMAQLFPDSRYASYPMMFHRAAKVGSLVNPQLDDFRKIMFNPLIYTTWERLMVSTGMPTNKLFPTILVSLVTSTLSFIMSAVSTSLEDGFILAFNPAQLVVAAPLLVSVWGATLFISGKGFSSTQKSL